MNWLELPPLAPAGILAAEEALLDAAEAGICGETLSFWESAQHFIVLGYGNKAATEVNQSACERLGIPILRRISGGGTVLQGPGVLNYSLVLRATEGTPLATINGANQFIMQRNAQALTQLLSSAVECARPRALLRDQQTALRYSSEPRNAPPAAPGDGRTPVQVQGHTDLAIDARKFSGNAQRRKRTHLLFHGAILLNLNLDLLEQVLPMPTLEPDYRSGRSHKDFLTQLGVPAESVKQALRDAWAATGIGNLDAQFPEWRASVAKLTTEKYSRPGWNFRV
jgi:lipoate---protein ligase